MTILAAWLQARQRAEQTPETRNRFVDFMRAASIGLVIIGHWLAAVSYLENGELILVHITNLALWSHWATWLFQVMPVIFMVGGYANAASWESARRKKQPFGLWIAVRLRRLVTPLLPLLFVWYAVSVILIPTDINPGLLQVASQIALNPIWFLAVYLLVVLMTPMTYSLWQRYGIGSFWGLLAAAMLVDAIAFMGDVPLIRWLNYAFVWLAVSQLGYRWRQNGTVSSVRAGYWVAGGLITTLMLVIMMPYPISMISVPGADLSNSRPPTVALLTLAMTQFGFLLAIEKPIRHWLRKPLVWTATVFVNGSIMTFFLWHLSALAFVVSLSYLFGGYGMRSLPLTMEWFAARPPWIITLVVVLFGISLIFARFEYGAKLKPVRPLAVWRAVVGTVMLCNGLALIALKGIGGEGPYAIQFLALILFVSGCVLAIGQGLFTGHRRTQMADE